MLRKLAENVKSLGQNPILSPLFFSLYEIAVFFRYHGLLLKWKLQGAYLPAKVQQELVRQKATFIFKSFQRQRMSKRLYRNIQHFYPGVRVIIADDSRKPLNLNGPGLEVVHLPFNSGLSAGLNQALKRVRTPFVVRMDDDELLTPHSNFHDHLAFLLAHPEVDLVGVMPLNLLSPNPVREAAESYLHNSMAGAPKPLRLPHGTKITDRYTVTGKTPNIFIVRTAPYRAVGYDDNIRMLDHNDFFYRAAGNLVSVLDCESLVAHCHNLFDLSYHKYRSDFQGDRAYILQKLCSQMLLRRSQAAGNGQRRSEENHGKNE